MSAEETLANIAKEVSNCQKCRLHESRKKSVPGEGPAHADILFIGEGPGQNENEQGRPFVGAAGKFLVELLASIRLKREEVFICNVVKCRPPGNRDPMPDEIEACKAYLDAQIAAINPAVIVTLGRFSMARYFGMAKISSVHGQATKIGDRLVVAMFHPAAALHQPQLKSTIIQDFGKLPGLIEKSRKETEAAAVAAQKLAEQTETTQLSLF